MISPENITYLPGFRNLVKAAGESMGVPLKLTVVSQESPTEHELGRYFLMQVRKYRGRERMLSDGTILTSESNIGQLHLFRNLKNMHVYEPRYRLQRFLADIAQSLIALDSKADRLPNCQFQALMGISALITPRTAVLLGFDYEPCASPLQRLSAAYFGALIASKEDNKVDAQVLLKNVRHQYKRVATFWLSREQLRKNQPLYEKLFEKYKHTLPYWQLKP